MKGIIRGKQEITAICIIVLASILGLVLRWQGIWEESGDFQSCLSIWMDHLKSGNGIRVLSQYTGDYNMPYVTVQDTLINLKFGCRWVIIKDIS